MCRILIGAGLAALAVLAGVLFAGGGSAALERWASEGQRVFQEAMAVHLRALRAGEAGALLALAGVCFAYGFFHAVGPGHGKVLIGGYGIARRVRLLPLTALALASSLAQAGSAVVLVYGGIWLLGLTRTELAGAAEGWMSRASQAAILGIGLWLALRGLRGLAGVRAGPRHHAHDHDCGHAHGPTLEDAARVAGWRDAAVLIGGIAIRPCTGALLLLVLTWQLGVAMAGVVGAFAMGLGTASVVVVVALLAVSLREGGYAVMPGVARLAPVMELSAGLLVALLALSLLMQAG